MHLLLFLVFLFCSSSTFLLFFLSHCCFAASDLFSIPRLIFTVARDIRPLSDSVVPYRAIYPASMANGRHIDNGELYTLFKYVALAHITYRCDNAWPEALSASPYRFLVPLRKGPSTANVASLTAVVVFLQTSYHENEIR